MSTPPSPDARPEPPPPELAPALAHFENGNYRATIAILKQFLATNPPPEITEAARALLARMAPDPWSLRLGLATMAVLVLLVVVYVF